MTREEAIVKFEKQLTSAMVVLDSGFGTRPGESDRVYRERKELAEIALTALRQQECVGETNKALTLDELRKMDNQPVWIEDVGEYKWHGFGWAIVDREHCLVRKASNGNPAFFERYGKEWIAYRQKPEEKHEH